MPLDPDLRRQLVGVLSNHAATSHPRMECSCGWKADGKTYADHIADLVGTGREPARRFVVLSIDATEGSVRNLIVDLERQGEGRAHLTAESSWRHDAEQVALALEARPPRSDAEPF